MTSPPRRTRRTGGNILLPSRLDKTRGAVSHVIPRRCTEHNLSAVEGRRAGFNLWFNLRVLRVLCVKAHIRAAGKAIRNRLPPPLTDSSVKRPPLTSTAHFAIDRPTPAPAPARERPPRLNRLNLRVAASG